MIKNDQLIGLCDEIAALVRMDLPLEASLCQRSRDLPRKLGRQVQKLAERIELGEPLAQALKKDHDFPPVYAAIVEAGLESGNLSGTLELIAKNLRILRDSRNFLIGATLYPMFVFTILWILLTWVIWGIGPAFVDFYENFSFTLPFFDRLAFCRENPKEYLLGMFLALVVLWAFYGFWCYRSSRALLLTFRPPRLFFWLRSANRNLAKATFAQVMALLIRSGLPLSQAFWLAFRSTGDADWGRENEETLEKITSSNKKTLEGLHPKSPITPLVQWIIGVPDRTILLSGLEQYAEMGVFKAKSHLDRLELWLPVVMMFLLGGAIFAAYFITIVFPYGYLLYHMALITP